MEAPEESYTAPTTSVDVVCAISRNGSIMCNLIRWTFASLCSLSLPVQPDMLVWINVYELDTEINFEFDPNRYCCTIVKRESCPALQVIAASQFKAVEESGVFNYCSLYVCARNGSNTAIFSVVNSVLLKPPDSRFRSARNRGTYGTRSSRAATFLDWKQQSASFEQMAAAQAWGGSLRGTGRPEPPWVYASRRICSRCSECRRSRVVHLHKMMTGTWS